MAKSGPTSELNHDSSNQEEKPEEAGSFKRADSDTFKTREVEHTTRRTISIACSGSDSPNRMNAFSSFAGFKAPASTSSPSFSFLSQKSEDNSESKDKGIARNETLGRENTDFRKTAKRGPKSVLCPENWNQEEKPEEAGTFKRADPNILKAREIKQLKRSSISSPSNSPNQINAFSSFAGFKAPASTSSPSFSFLSQKSEDNSESKDKGIARNETLGRENTDSRRTAKRGPTSVLNHDNWNQEEKPEEAGTFKRADPNILKTREIKQAKRRSTSSPCSGSDSPNQINAFSSFAGFKYPATTSVSSFSFLSEKGEDKNESISKENASNKYAGRPNEFYADLRSLNESVSKWIISHVDDNPSCVLSPVFKDYEKHLASLEKMYPKKEYTSPKVESRTTNATIAETTPSLNISTTVNNGDKDSTETKSPSVKPAFSFNFSRDSNDSNRETSKFKTSIFTSLTSSPAGNITCGLNKDSINSVFGRGQPFTFGNVSQPAATSTTDGEENEDPPKVEFTPVVEEDSLYSIRCKVFVKKGGTYQDRGVGTMYLKSVVNSTKVQLIVRADTSLGNLLLNILLPCAVPAKKMGNNNVMLACIPTPDSEPPPVPVLLRVKTSEDADTVLEKINSCAK